MRTPYVVMAVIGLALLGGWAALHRDAAPDAPRAAASARPAPSRSASPRPASSRPAPVRVIARRVEALRGLRFSRLPAPVAVTPAQAEREGLEDLDRSYPPARRHADEEVLKLLELVAPSVSLRDVSASTFSEGVAGYYDPRTKRLRTVSGAATGTRVLAEMVLAHELTHALEDQHFSLRLGGAGGEDDRALAGLALVEGTATALMYRYVERWFSGEEALGGLLASAFADTASLPPFLEAQLVFPYTGGRAFVEDLLRRAGGRWTLVDLAERSRPPASTEQVLHPEAWLRVSPPVPVRLKVSPGRGFRRVVAGTLGELQTRELLAAAGGGGSAQAAAGWGGDRYELWQRGSCSAPPCRGDDVLVMRWRWDTPRDEREFAAKLRQWVHDGLGGVGGGVVVARRAGAVTLALAPSRSLARRVAAR